MNNNNYRIIRTIYENLYQRVLECVDNDTNEIFYNNIITSEKIFKLINIEDLRKIPTNIIESNKTGDRIYIITKPLENKDRSVKEYIRTNSITLKEQFALTKNIIELSSDIYDMTDIVQQKILDLDKLYIDEKGEIIVNCDLIFEQDYDISDNETLKRMGNIIHFIFSGTEIEDYNISELIPPDILKIIVRSLTKEYMYPKNALTELVTSPLYKMIAGDVDTNLEKDSSLNLDLPESNNVNVDNVENEKEDLNDENIKENNVYDIYLNTSEGKNKKVSRKSKKNKNISKKDLNRLLFPILIVILVLVIGNKLMDVFSDDSLEVSGDANDTINSDIELGEDTDNPNESISSHDSTDKYFNNELINKINYTGQRAEIDDEIYVEGDKSLLITNESEEKTKALFATVDFTDEDFSYLLKQQIGVSAKIKAEKDVTVLVVLEAYKDDDIASNFHTKIEVFDDMWSQAHIPINVTNADYLNIYLEYSGPNKVWVDSLYIDVVK